ncbi:MAG: glycosyl hydrolase, partial [Panacibacter sp.]
IIPFQKLTYSWKGSSGNGPVNSKQLTGEDTEGVVVKPSPEGQQAWLQFEFEKPYEAKSIRFFIAAINTGSENNLLPEFSERTHITLEASDDGIQFRLITLINTGLEGELLINDKFINYDIPETTAKYFRLSSKQIRRYKQVQFSGINRLKNWMEKTNNRGAYFSNVGDTFGLPDYRKQEDPPGCVIDLNAMVDLSKNMDKEGLLQWNVPAGDWTIMRIGFSATGALNRAAPDTGIGLECDKFSSEAYDFHFNKMIEKLLPMMATLAAKGKIGLEIDSYEAGSQNWAVGFEDEFFKRWNYNLLKYLPAIAGGRIVGSVEITERFLWNFRRLQADMMADNYYGRFNELCHRHNIISNIEPYDQGPMEEMQIGSRVDVNMGEFWNGYSSAIPVRHPVRRTLKLAASIAHINDQTVVGAESFTAEPDSGRWQEYPFALKAAGDMAFINGINKLIIHRFVHQPNSNVLPGMTMGPWGIHFDRTTTWWKQGRAWLGYLSRCQHMLRQGKFVADILYFTGENPNMYTRVNKDELNPTPPDGYDYDLINAETLFKKITINNKRITLQSGMQYPLLVLQNYNAISLSFLYRLRYLVQQGMQLFGAKPFYSLGLENYEDNDALFTKTVDELWGDIDGSIITEHAFGKGRVYWGVSLKSVLQKLNIQPDFEFSSRSGDAPIFYTHRRTADADIYFIVNKRRTYEDIVCAFRVNNKQPECWDAVTGKIISINVCEKLANQIRVPLQLGPYGSIFVVFRKQIQITSIDAILKDNQLLFCTNDFAKQPRQLYKDVSNNFTIAFWAKPEINILLDPNFIMGTLKNIWTDYYAIYPSPGNELYGAGHATCGLTVGRNGIAVWENGSGNPELVLAVEVPVSGWSQIVLIYNNGKPTVYLNGQFLKEGKTSNNIVHPGLGEVFVSEGASFYNGDMTAPELYTEHLSEERIAALALKPPTGLPGIISITEIRGINNNPTFLIRENGNYRFEYNNARISEINIFEFDQPIEIKGAWQVSFPPGFGAPSQIILPELISFHKHADDAVKYFSGTANYKKEFTISSQLLKKDNRILLDLGSVEVIAEVTVNGKDFGVLWKRPYHVDVTNALHAGVNTLEIKVTNQWVNRLIGDEQMPNPYAYTPGGGESGIPGIGGGAIEELPHWYLQGKNKPNDGRITFTTWKHFNKDAPLIESGLIGPVVLQSAILITP